MLIVGQPESPPETITVLTFFVNGVASLIGWYSMLNSLDYFAKIYEGYNVYSFFLLAFFIGNIATAIFFRYLSHRYHYMKLVYIGIIITNSALVLLFLTLLMFEYTKGLSFTISLLACCCMGVVGNMSQLSFFAMINYLDRDSVIKFTGGTAIGGILLTLCRMIIVAIVGSDSTSSIPILIYFLIAIAVNLLDLVLNVKFARSNDYKKKILSFLPYKKSKHSLINSSNNQNSKYPISINNDTAAEGSIDTGGKSADESVNTIEQYLYSKPYYLILWYTNKAVHPYPLIIMLNFVITLGLFPGLAVQKKFEIDFVWSSLIMILLYGLGDMTGKFLVKVKSSFNHTSIMYLLCSRLYFFFTVPILASGAANSDPLIDNDVFPFINIFMFSLSSGFVVSASIILAFKICPLKYKEHTGVLCGIVSQLGLMLGTLLDIPLQKVVHA